MEKDKKYKFIASIKIGASFSGYAYSFLDDFTENPLKIGTYDWQVHDRYTTQKIASSILFRPDGTLDSFGYEAEMKYGEFKSEKDKPFYLQRFPHENTALSAETELTDEYGNKMLALTVYASAIRALKNHLVSKIQNSLYNLPDSDILWTMVDPDNNNEDFYKKAAEEAGITGMCVVIPKSDASIAYYKCACRNRGTHFSPQSKYMVINAAAQHLDVSIYSKDGCMELLKKRKLIDIGDSFNSAIQEILKPIRSIMDASLTAEYKAKIMTDIEFQKRKFKPNKTSNFCLRLPHYLEDKENFTDAFHKSSFADKISVERGQIRISYDVIRRVFVDAAESIADYVRKMLDKDDTRACPGNIVMIGGCSESLFLQNAMKKAFPDCTIYVPFETSMIDVKGAAIFCHLKDVICKIQKFASSTSIISTLQGKKQKTRNMRVIVIGEERVGKTTLCKRLMKEHVVMEEITSTEGIDISIQRFVVDLETKEIVKLPEGTEIENTIKRIVRVLQSTDSKEDKEPDDVCSGISVTTEHVQMREKVTRSETVVVCPPSTEGKLKQQKSADYLDSNEGKPNAAEARKRFSSSSSSANKKQIQKQNTADLEAPQREDAETVVEKAKWMISMEENINDKEAFLSLWDCGGQESFYNTHHIFFSSDAIYLIVYNTTKCLGPNKKQALDRVKYWVRSIGTYADDEDDKLRSTPPMLLVGTHLDEIKGTEEEIRNQIAEVHNALCDDEDLQYTRAQSQGIYDVDNNSEDPSYFTELWQAIVDSAQYQAQWEKELPAKWLSLEKNLMQKKSEGLKLMTMEEVKELDKNGMVAIEDEKEIKLFLRYMNFTGCMLYFGEGDCSTGQHLKDIVILNPQWLSNAFCLIITSPQFAKRHKKNPKLDMRWKIYQKTAELDDDLLEMVWNQDESEQYFKHKDILLSFMERLGLIAKPKSNKPKRRFLVPSMLQTSVSTDDLSGDLRHRHTQITRTLCVVFQDRFIPSPIFDKLIAACIEKYEVIKKDNKRLLRRGVGVFKVDSTWNLIVNCSGHMVKIAMYKQAPVDATKHEPGVGLKVRLFIEDALKQLIDLYKHRHLKFDYHIDCKIFKETDSQTIPKSDLEDKGQMPCCDGEHFLNEKDLLVWFTGDQKDECEDDDDLTSEVLDRAPTDKELSRLSHQVVCNYHLLFTELGLQLDRIQEIVTDHKDKSTAEKILFLFRSWGDKAGQRGTTRVIIDAMKNQEMNVSCLKKIFDP